MAKKTSRKHKRVATRAESGTGGDASELPKGFRRRRSIPAPDAHLLVATTSSFMAAPPFICVPTGPPPFPCLRYGLDPNTGQYSIPPFGQPMDCAACRASQ
jgi:hypothetical protein